MVSIETVAPLRDNAPSEGARSTVEFLHLETPGFISPELWPPNIVWLGGRLVRTLDLRSIGREFESWPLRYRVQPWASC